MRIDLRQGIELNADEVFQNMATDLGLLKALGLLLRLAPCGLWFGGIPCDSYGFLSSPTHSRSAVNPFGKPLPFVMTGSILCTRYAMLALIAIIRMGVWACEQPDRSTLQFMPPMELLFRQYLQPLMVKWFGAYINIFLAQQVSIH